MDWRERYLALRQYTNKLESENADLRSRLGLTDTVSRMQLDLFSIKAITSSDQDTAPIEAPYISQLSSPKEKIGFFRSLFRGREDVFARRWYSFKSGKSGYAPVCLNEWGNTWPSSSFDHIQRKFKPLDDQDFYRHLNGADEYGRDVIGIYPISQDDACFFLAIDFDDGAWKENVATVRQICNEWSVPCAIERSRSGEGAHIWIFFSEPIACATARRLGSLLLTVAMARSGNITLSSYDRMFPCQDTLPKGGFGNLIALPLQGRARKNENSLFVDDNFLSYPDQWAYLSQIKKFSLSEIESLLRKHSKHDVLGGLYHSEQKPWEKIKDCNLTPEDFGGNQHIVKANMLFIQQDKLSPRARNQLIRLAAFQNPDFYKSQAMRLPVYNKPRIISTAEERDGYLALPRGCEPQLAELLKKSGIAYGITDKTFAGRPLSVCFQGSLRPEQTLAAKSLLNYENGILAATTAFGKTVVAASIIAERKINTLILVHTQALLNQWKKSLDEFLIFDEPLSGQPKKRDRKPDSSHIGQIGGGKNTAKGFVDIAIMRSLITNNQVKELVKDYGMVIVDECHHASAVSYERILKDVNAHYVYGLTATPARRDGHHPVMYLQCGPIRHRVDAKVQAENRCFTHIVIPRFTNFSQPPSENHAWTITDIYRAIQQDKGRNAQIVADTIQAVANNRTPLLLTERYEHAQLLFRELSKKIKRVILLSGRGSAKEKRETLKMLEDISPDEPMALVATGRYVGEGFDFPRLDTLMLAMPVSWQGTLAQYAGRLHRDYYDKQEVLIYDYVDLRIPMLERMYQRRLTGYSAIGYGVRGETSGPISDMATRDRIFNLDDYKTTFSGDVRNTKKSIFIASPYLQLGRIGQFLSWIPKNIKVQVVTNDEACFKPETEQKVKAAITLLEKNGVSVKRIPRQCQRFAVFDQQLLWYGGINYLGYERNAANGAMRLFSAELAKELLNAQKV